MALLLLRLAAVVALAGACVFALNNSSPALAAALALPALLLFFGFGTRIAAFACAAIAVGIGMKMADWHSAALALEALNLISIGLLGAGAYSVDAHLFGRRVINLDN